MKPKYLAQDVRQRLEGGVIIYGGLPHFVTQTDGGSSKPLYLVPLADMNRKAIPVALDDPDLDVSSQPLGYLNHRGKAYYYIRNPLRMYKQSMCVQSMSVWSPDYQSYFYDCRGGRGSRQEQLASAMLLSQSGHCMFTNTYPTSKSAIASLVDGSATSVAVSREVALTKNDFGVYHVWYKMQTVGYLDAQHKVKVPDDQLSFIVVNLLKPFIEN